MSFETVSQELNNANISYQLIDEKFTDLLISPNSTLTDSEAWDLIDSEGLRYVFPDPIEITQPDFIGWRMQTVQSTEFQAIANAIGLKNLTVGTAILIAFSKIEDAASLQNAIDLWNVSVNLTSLTNQQIDKLNELSVKYNIPINLVNNGQIEVTS